MDSEGTVQLTTVAESATLGSHPHNLGSVDWVWTDYGPLSVEVQWGDKIEDPAFGDCDWPPNAVSIMGYLLEYSDGSIADEVDIDVDPMTCTSDLFWMTDLDTYALTIYGEDAAGTTLWGTEFLDLVVDSNYENDYLVEVDMTVSP